jgi:hypothetical protein
MFDPQSDPLGLGLKARARARRQSLQTLQPQAAGYMSGPLPDENWDAFFQAVSESAGGKPVNFVGGSAPRGNAPDVNAPGGVDPEAVAGMKFAQNSNQFAGRPTNSLLGPGSHAQNVLAYTGHAPKKNSLQGLLDLLKQQGTP